MKKLKRFVVEYDCEVSGNKNTNISIVYSDNKDENNIKKIIEEKNFDYKNIKIIGIRTMR